MCGQGKRGGELLVHFFCHLKNSEKLAVGIEWGVEGMVQIISAFILVSLKIV